MERRVHGGCECRDEGASEQVNACDEAADILCLQFFVHAIALEAISNVRSLLRKVGHVGRGADQGEDTVDGALTPNSGRVDDANGPECVHLASQRNSR